MAKHLLKFYPVDNGDMTLLYLADKTTILIDCKIREGEETDAGNKNYPVKQDLLDSIQKRKNNPYLDLFILTHPDKDHCQGFEKNFYCGDPDKYNEDNKDNEEIIIDEMWVTSLLFNHTKNLDAKAFKKEAERRRKLWEEDSEDRDKPGNRIRMVGYDGDEKFENVPNVVPGEFISQINGDVKDDFEFFVHGPFKQSLIESNANGDGNSSSIIMQARFKVNATDEEFACYYLFGGDADHYRWEQVLKKSKKHGHEEELKWDIFLTPHHCSWTFFNDTKYEDNKEPKESSLEILDNKLGDGKIIAACKVIKSNDDDPPHYPAKQEYLKKVNKPEHFIELAKHPKEKEPKPYVFEVTPSGPDKEKEKEGSAAAAIGGTSAVINKKSEYGSQSF